MLYNAWMQIQVFFSTELKEESNNINFRATFFNDFF
jgi:hypothetical protein